MAGLRDLHERLKLTHGWTMIGGQLVHLHCAERGQFPVWPMNDPDIVLRILGSTTDRNSAGAEVAVARGRHPETDPMAALRHWLRLRGTTPGPMFVPLRGEARRGERAPQHLRPTAQLNYAVSSRSTLLWEG